MNRILLFLCVSVLAVHAIAFVPEAPKPKPPPEPFCYNGIAPPELEPEARVGVRFIEAPLLSVTYGPIPGDLLHAYHVAILLETATNNYTLEFDAEYGMGSGVLPVVKNTSSTSPNLFWNNAGRFCLTDGILHDRKHWSVAFTEVTSISGAQFADLFKTYVAKTNVTAEYELMRAIGRNGEVLVQDNTCSGGIRDTLLFIEKTYNSTLLPGTEKLRTTSFTFHATSAQLLDVSNTSSADWHDVLTYYEEITEALGKGVSLKQRVEDLIKVVRGHAYVYKEGKYYRLVGMHFPFVTLSRVPVFAAPGEKEEQISLFDVIGGGL